MSLTQTNHSDAFSSTFNGHAIEGKVLEPRAHHVNIPKYKHVMAVHSKARPSCLTHGTEGVSFAGFRNLMVLVICMIIASAY